jgi:hypothetical protein
VTIGYIARFKRYEKEKEAYDSSGYSARGNFHGRASTGYNTSYRSGPKRGGYYGSYHPYHRPQKFANRSVTFNGTDQTTEASEANETEDSSHASTESTVPATRGQQYTEPQAHALCPGFTSTGISAKRQSGSHTPLCPSNICVGVCSRHGCSYLHDPNKQAICRRWLYTDCNKGETCLLSHEASLHNAPTCTHFQDGRCNKDDCHFAHIRVNPAALNCEAFGRLGYCEKGDTCSELHAHECPTFANTGACRFGDKCRHGHVRRANRMRKAARVSSPTRSTTSDGSDVTEDDMDTAQDSHEWVMPQTSDQKPHQFTQQEDFVALNSDE